MAIIKYDTNPALSVDEKMQSLMASIQLALNERPGGSSAGGAGMVGDMSKAQLKNIIDTQIKARDQEKYPVGKLWLSVDNINPAEILGFGTWVRVGKGKAIVGVDEADDDFNTAELTPGSKDAIIPSHTHSLEGHTHGIGNHTHSMSHNHSFSGSGSTDSSYGSLSLPYRVDLGGGGNYTALTDRNSSGSSYFSGDSHYHSVSISGTTGSSSSSSTGGASGNTESGGAGDTGSAGVSGAGKNVQPSYTVYMFKRTA